MRSRLFTAATFLLLAGTQLHANTFIFATAPSANDGAGHPVDIQVDIDVESSTYMVITLFNLEANPTADTQDPNALVFDLGTSLSSLGTVTITSSAQTVFVNSNGSYTLGATGSTTWNTAVSSADTNLTQFNICDFNNTAIGCTTSAKDNWPAYTLIGPPGPSGYTNAGGSLSSKSHTPELFEEAQFYITLTNSTYLLNPNATTPPFTSMNAGFGTSSTVTNLVPYVTYTTGTPEPTPLILMGTGVALIFVGRWRRRRPSRG